MWEVLINWSGRVDGAGLFQSPSDAAKSQVTPPSTRGYEPRYGPRRPSTTPVPPAPHPDAETQLDRVLHGQLVVVLGMGSGRWGWIVPDGLWELARPLLPPARVRPQGGGVANINDEAVFAAIVYVLVSGCVWRALPPCFGASKSTVHRRFAIWSRAGVWGRPHQRVLQLLDEQDLIDLSRAVLDSAHVRATRPAGRERTAPTRRALRGQHPRQPGPEADAVPFPHGTRIPRGRSQASTPAC